MAAATSPHALTPAALQRRDASLQEREKNVLAREDKLEKAGRELDQNKAELERARVAHAYEAGRIEERMVALREVDAALAVKLTSIDARLGRLDLLIARGEAAVARLEGLPGSSSSSGAALPPPRAAGTLRVAEAGAEPAAPGVRAARSRTPRAREGG